MPKKAKAPKISPEELHESFRQEEARRYAEEQERLRVKVAQELKEHNQRRVLLLETGKLFRKLERVAHEYRRQQDGRKEWDDFLSCRKAPNPDSAPELREALFRWSVQQEEAASKSLAGWTVNKRIPFSQANAPTARRTPKEDVDATIHRNMGDIYVPTVREALDVLQSIDDGPRGHTQTQDEVTLARDEIRKFISDSLDRMTFRVGNSVMRNMVCVNPLMSEFNFREPNVLALYLWSFRPVPLPPDFNLLSKVIEMPSLALALHRPPSLGLDHSLIRGLWLEFDHFSDQDPTLSVGAPHRTLELNSTQETEWIERQEIRRKRLAALRKQRDDYEAQQRAAQEAEAEALALKTPKGAPAKSKEPKAKPQSKKDKKKGKQAQEMVPEPAVITEETEVDIDAEYERLEADQFWATMACVAPGDALALDEGYLNLREFHMVGGVYQLTRYDQLPQPIDLRPDFVYCNIAAGLKLSEKRFQTNPDDEENAGDELIKIELQLPARCYWWEQPTVCWWEPWEESAQFASLHPEVQQFQLQHAEIEARKATLLFSAPELDSRLLKVSPIVQDFDLTNIPVEVRLHFLIRSHILPRLPEGYRFRAELKRLYTILKEREERRLARRREEAVRDTMLLKYDRIRALPASEQEVGGAVAELRLPEEIDIEIEEDRPTTDDADARRESASEALQEPDEKLQPFSLVRPDAARFLHPPNRPTSFDALEPERASFPELGPEMEALVQALESSQGMLNDDTDELLCRMFSTFLRLLEYLRSKQVPDFPPLPPPSSAADILKQPARTAVKEPRRRFIDIRTTKKYPLGLGSRVRSLSRASESSVTSAGKKKRKRKSSQQRAKLGSQTQPVGQAEETVDGPPEGGYSLIEHAPGRWSTKPIRKQSYDAVRHVLTFWTDRLGTFGLAARRYQHLPFLHWEMRRQGRVANLTTVITLSARLVDIIFLITSQGFRVQVHDRSAESESPEAGKRTDSEGKVPPSGWFSLEELEKYLLKINVHVFAEVDTCFYTGTVPKHEAMERHNLRCLGAFCLTHNVQRCLWNEFANRRTGLLLARQLIEGRHEPEFETIMITPLKSLLVEVEELCSSTLEEVLLEFHPRPEDQSYNADCYGLLKDGLEEPSRKVLAKTPPLLQWNVSQLLEKLRLLSYS